MSTLQQLSTVDLTAELKRREKSQAKLRARHKVLQAELAQIEAELAGPALSGGRGKASTGKSKATRPKNTLTLHDAIAAAVPVGDVVSPKNAAAAILATGYQTVSKTFGVQVAGRLAKDERFERAERGLYKRVK